jgi:hypothetical protein
MGIRPPSRPPRVSRWGNCIGLDNSSFFEFDFLLELGLIPDGKMITVGTPGLGVRQPDGKSSGWKNRQPDGSNPGKIEFKL